jgi:hypothetical protein
MIIEESGKAEERIVKKAVKKNVKKEVLFDTLFANVIQWQEEGYDLLFSWDTPIILSSDEFKKLNPKNKDRYYQAKFSAEGQDLTKTSLSAQKPYKDEYSVRPGSPNEKLTVLNKEAGMEYRWEIPVRVSAKESQGWVVDEGSARKQINNDAGSSIKSIGMKGKEELILMKIPKSIIKEREQKNRDRYQKTKDYQLETFERLATGIGSKVLN